MLRSISNPIPVPVSRGGTGLASYPQLARQLIARLPSYATVIPAGDSITAGSNTANSFDMRTDYITSSLIAAKRFRILRNAGVAGNTAAQLLARLNTDVIAYHPDVVPVLIGTNNLAAGMTNADYAALMNTVEQIITSLIANGIVPVLVTPPPKNAAASEAKNIQWYYYQLSNYYHIPLIDLFRIWADPTGAASWTAAYSGDGVHPSKVGIAFAQPYITNVLQNIHNAQQYPYLGTVSETSTGSFSNLVRNGAFAKITTPPAPDSWTINTTNATYTTPTASYPYSGNDFNYVKTVDGAAYALYGATITTGFSATDTIYLAARINTSGIAVATATNYSLVLDANAGQDPIFKSTYNLDGIYAANFTLDPSATTLIPQVYVIDAGTYIVNNITAVNVTAHDAVWKPGQQGL